LLADARYGTSKKCSYENGGIPVLRIPNVIGGLISLDDLKYSHLSDSERAGLKLNSCDIVVIRTNRSVSLVGRAAVFTEINDIVGFASCLIRLRPMLQELGEIITKIIGNYRNQYPAE
jgi:type I restriction enzyme, S subunit